MPWSVMFAARKHSRDQPRAQYPAMSNDPLAHIDHLANYLAAKGLLSQEGPEGFVEQIFSWKPPDAPGTIRYYRIAKLIEAAVRKNKIVYIDTSLVIEMHAEGGQYVDIEYAKGIDPRECKPGVAVEIQACLYRVFDGSHRAYARGVAGFAKFPCYSLTRAEADAAAYVGGSPEEARRNVMEAKAKELAGTGVEIIGGTLPVDPAIAKNLAQAIRAPMFRTPKGKKP